jgi:hypothetical protein
MSLIEKLDSPKTRLPSVGSNIIEETIQGEIPIASDSDLDGARLFLKPRWQLAGKNERCYLPNNL